MPAPGFRRRCWHLFSTTFRYALISLVELAVEARTLQPRQIASKFALSPHHLAVVLRDLRRLGLVESIKGNQGGYRQCRPTGDINLLELYSSLAGSDGSGAQAQAARSPSEADRWLMERAERWGRELAATSLQDLCGTTP